MSYAKDLMTASADSHPLSDDATGLRIGVFRFARRMRTERAVDSMSDGQFAVLAGLCVLEQVHRDLSFDRGFADFRVARIVERIPPGCRAFFLFRNDTDLALEAFEMSLAVLDAQGVIDRLLTIDAAPLPAHRTTLKLFEIPGLGCDQITEILMHDIPTCKPQNADPVDCYSFLALASKAGARLVE